ncbi:hypothetical protein LCGC14_0636670 [marine sediment metagenome]|uniref:Uncharacterized protein n=1 Tax=marine sediment metagenome TaxID=412755 RepID=A0A0F9TLT9_9ZZZZ|nr:MAG: hypothetical protein Lokiarch_10510 [Candidatus Lokiarchaeum sp. GC14_75]
MSKKRLNKNFLDEFKDYNFSKIRENKIFLVGSIRFKDYFIKIESILQIFYSKIVYVCSVDGLLNKIEFSSNEWEKLQDIALRKLEEQDAILVLDVENYIGEHTAKEIENFEKKHKKPRYYLLKLTRKSKIQ